jgi:hypothetical protein
MDLSKSSRREGYLLVAGFLLDLEWTRWDNLLVELVNFCVEVGTFIKDARVLIAAGNKSF